jgi:hypothetical protein
MKKSYLIAALLFTGCFFNDSQPTAPQSKSIINTTTKTVVKTKPLNIKSCPKPVVFEVVGRGVAPCNGGCSAAQSMVMARRSAIVDGYRALAEKVYGIKINGKDTVRNMILQNSDVRAYVNGLIKGANIEDESYKNGIYKVVMSLKINENDWKNIINTSNTCK